MRNSTPSACRRLEAAVQDVLAQLEVGDAVAEQATDPVGALEDGHRVPGAIELIGGSQPGRAGSDDGHRPPGALVRWAWRGPALRKGTLDDGGLDGLDGHGWLVDAEHAGRLARRRADPAGELGEAVGGVEGLQRALPLAAVDVVIEVGDDVSQRAAVMAEGHRAVHAAGALLLQLRRRHGQRELPPVADALLGWLVGRGLAGELLEAGDLAHDRPYAATAASAASSASARR